MGTVHVQRWLSLPHLGTQAVQKYPFLLLMRLNLVVGVITQAALLSEELPGAVLSCSSRQPPQPLPQQRARVVWF